MQTSLILEWKHAILRELNAHKRRVLVAYVVVLLALILVAFLWPKRYESGAVLFVDEKKISQMLLEGKAAVTGLGADPMDMVTERITSVEFLEDVVVEAQLVKNPDDRLAIRSLAGGIGSRIDVQDIGRNYLKVTYTDPDPAQAHKLATVIAKSIISNSLQTKRGESKDAYAFIEQQVESYRAKLQAAEDRLKEFKSQYTDGTEGSSGQRITQLRKDIEDLTLEAQVARARRDELRNQISRESQVISQNFRANVYRERLNEAQSRLDTLRLSYQDTYPDIVSLKFQIEDLKRAITEAETGGGVQSSAGSPINPVYQQMRSSLTEAEVNVRTLEMRLGSSRNSLREEESRSKRSAEVDARQVELTRDYDVTRGLYEDMLQRREKARVSMALDDAGQSAAFKITQPAQLPTKPAGLTFIHIFSAAPVIAILAPLLLIGAFIHLDPRVRFTARVQEALPSDLAILAVIPHTVSPYERRISRGEWLQYAAVAGGMLLVYFGIAAVRILGGHA